MNRDTIRAFIPRGFGRMTNYPAMVTILDASTGVGHCVCPDCVGTGSVEFYDGPEKCIACKGTGRIFVSI